MDDIILKEIERDLEGLRRIARSISDLTVQTAIESRVQSIERALLKIEEGSTLSASVRLGKGQQPFTQALTPMLSEEAQTEYWE